MLDRLLRFLGLPQTPPGPPGAAPGPSSASQPASAPKPAPEAPRPILAALIGQEQVKRSPSYTPRAKSASDRWPDVIVLHATEGPMPGCLDWLTRNDHPNPTSAHYIVTKAGEVWRLVDEEDIAWHAGYGTWKGVGHLNARSIGVELESNNQADSGYTEAQLSAALWVCLRAMRRWRISSPDSVAGHDAVDQRRDGNGRKVKTDPIGFPWERFRASLAHALAEGGTT